MPINCENTRWRQTLLTIGVSVACGLIGVVGVQAQGLDMDAGATRAAPPAHRPGDLDMDVNPDAPIAPGAAAVPASPRDNVQDGISRQTAIVPADTPLAPTDTPATPVPPGGVATSTPANAPSEASPAPATVVEQASPAEPVTLDHPKVVDTAKLQSGDISVSLYGIEGLSGSYADGLQGFLGAGNGKVTCQAQASSGFVCLMADGTNVAQVALVNGAAKTTPDAPDSYREEEAAAQAARRGIWVNLPPPPEPVKHPVVQDTATLFAEGKTYVLDGVVGFQAPYAGQLQGYIAGNGDSVTCSPQNDAGHYVCLMPDGTDVAKVALVNGAARVDQDAPDSYRVQQLDALNNRRGYWATAPEAVMTAALLPPEPQVQYSLAAGDDGTDGITYVGGAPVAMIDGASVFLVYGDDGLGWGYYDHYHHWRGAPGRYRDHMERFHPGGHGLRDHDAFYRHGEGMRGREAGMRPGEMHPGEMHPGPGGRAEAMRPGGMRPGMTGPMGRPGELHPGPGGRAEAMRPVGVHPGMAGPVGRSGMAGPFGRPGMGGPGMRPANMAMAGGRPGPGGGFMHPGPAASMGGFHPSGPGGGMRPPAPAMHASAPGPGGKHR